MNNNRSLVRQMSTASSIPSPTTEATRLDFFHNYNSDFTLSILVVNIVILFLAISLNFLIILTFVKTSAVRETPSNILVMGLAISDFGVGILSEPLACVYHFATLMDYKGLDTMVIGNAYIGVSILLFIISLLSLSAITIDRFLAIHLHLRYMEIVTTKRYGITVACIWITSLLLCASSVYIQTLLYRTVFLSIICIIVFINVFLIFKISRVIHRHSVQIQAQQQSIQQSLDMPRYKKSVNTMYFIVGAFLVCYLPFLGILLAVFIIPSTRSEEWTTVVLTLSLTFMMLNSVINPIIYCWRIEEMRKAAKKLIRKIWRQD